MSKGEKRVWVSLLPSMPKGEIVGMFYRQRILVIDGKYNNNDGMSIGKYKNKDGMSTGKNKNNDILLIRRLCLSLMARSECASMEK
jgi:hypothetical protein